MLSTRSLIVTAIALLLMVIAVGAYSLTRPPDSGGAGADSYGVRRYGYRALHDTLGELGIPVSRQLHPPIPPAGKATVVFIAPNPAVIASEPAYLQSLLPWVERGGRIVVAVSELKSMFLSSAVADETQRPTVLDVLGLGSVKVEFRSPMDGVVYASSSKPSLNLKPLDEVLADTFLPQTTPPRVQPTACTGGWLADGAEIRFLSVPGDQAGTLTLAESNANGTIQAMFANTAVTVAALFPRGQGEIVVVSEPRLFSNQLLANADNSVVAVRLMSPSGESVVIDEFYHGLSVRGNPLFLLTRPGYAAILIGLLAVTSMVVWREAVFLGPSLADEASSRRDVSEYLRSMGRFLGAGADTRPFLVNELRQGVLRELSAELSLSPEQKDAELITALLARRNPRRAENLRTALRRTDVLLASQQTWTASQTLEILRSLSSCLSKSM